MILTKEEQLKWELDITQDQAVVDCLVWGKGRNKRAIK